MDKRINYSGGMSPEAQAWADITGIAYGWFKSTLPDCDGFRIGCEICGFVVQEYIPHKLRDNFKEGPRAYLALRERWLTWLFESAGLERSCPHWPKYHEYRADTVARKCADALAQAKQAKKERSL